MTQQAPAPTWVGLGPCQTRGSRILYYYYDVIIISILLFTRLGIFKFIFAVSLRNFIFGQFSIGISKFSGIYRLFECVYMHLSGCDLVSEVELYRVTFGLVSVSISGIFRICLCMDFYFLICIKRIFYACAFEFSIVHTLWLLHGKDLQSFPDKLWNCLYLWRFFFVSFFFVRERETIFCPVGVARLRPSHPSYHVFNRQRMV